MAYREKSDGWDGLQLFYSLGRQAGKKYDAIVNGMKFEFKNQHGSSIRTLKDHFIDSREQAPNVFINLEYSPLTKQQIINTLSAARNSKGYGKKTDSREGGLS